MGHGSSRKARRRRARQGRLLLHPSYPPRLHHGYATPIPTNRARPPSKQCHLPLAPIAPPLSYEAIRSLAASVGYPHQSILCQMFNALQYRDHFLSLFPSPFPKSPGVPSRLHPDRLHEALAFDLIQEVSHHSPIYTSHSCFPVPKSDGLHSRFITNVTFNDQHLLPSEGGVEWSCPLPSFPQLIRRILGWSWAHEVDAQSFFPQFKLGKDIRPFFGIRQRGFRGVLTRMPQGWSKAPSIAQHTASAVTYNCSAPQDPSSGAFPWIDNLISGGTSLEAATSVLQTVLSRCADCHITLKAHEPCPSQELHVVGLHFDLKTSQYRLDQAWATSSSSFLLDYIHEASRGCPPPLRVTWTAIGIALWTSHVSLLPLGTHMWDTIMFMKRHTPRVQVSTAWDEKCTVHEDVIVELRSCQRRLAANPWLPKPPPLITLHQCKNLLITDASLWAGSFLCSLVDCPTITKVNGMWWQWTGRATGQWMPILEALALLRALQELQSRNCLPSDIVWLTDCEPVRKAFLRQYSPSAKLNGILRSIRQFPVNIVPCWIPSELNSADPFSRRTDFAPLQSLDGIALPDPALHAFISSPAYTGEAPRTSLKRKRG